MLRMVSDESRQLHVCVPTIFDNLHLFQVMHSVIYPQANACQPLLWEMREDREDREEKGADENYFLG